MIDYAMSLSALGAHIHEKEAAALRNYALRNVEILESPLQKNEEVRRSLELTSQLIREKIIVPASIHLPFWEPSALDESTRIRERNCIADTIRYYFDHGITAPDMTLHGSSGEAVPAEHPARIRQTRKTISELLPLMEEYHFSLNVEFLPRNCIGNSVEELKELIRDTDPEYVGICFDVNHVMDRYQELPEMIGELAPRIRTFHISDYNGVDECHWFPGQGIINWQAVMDAIRKIEHDVLLILETAPQLYSHMPPRELCPEFAVRENETAVWFLENCGRVQEEREHFIRNWNRK